MALDRTTQRDALATRLFEATLGAFELLSVHLGLDLGLYRTLHDDGPATAPEPAVRLGIHGGRLDPWPAGRTAASAAQPRLVRARRSRYRPGLTSAAGREGWSGASAGR